MNNKDQGGLRDCSNRYNNKMVLENKYENVKLQKADK